MDRPKLDPIAPRLRFLVEAESTGIPFTFALNKADLVQLEVISIVCAKDIDRWKEKLAEWGYEPLICSVSTLPSVAMIMGLLEDRISVEVDFSGVGKSSLINALHDDGGVDWWHKNKLLEQLQNWPLKNLKKMSVLKRYMELQALIMMDKVGRRSLVTVHIFL